MPSSGAPYIGDSFPQLDGPMSDYSTIRVERAHGRATVTVSRPDKLNALNADTIRELHRAFRELASDPDVRGVIITGEGEKAFVAGADIAELARMGPIDGIDVSRQGQEAFRLLERMGKPVVAAVNGYALGGGMELALACHIRIAADNARFGLPEVKLGIIPGYGGTVRLPRIVGRGLALEMILTGEMIPAQRALEIGLVNRVVPQAELRSAAEQLMDAILKNGPIALRFAIEAVDRSLETGVDEGLGLEAHLFGLLASTQDMREGMAAFLEKRTAGFSGR
jgi:enoyl-CoA hydratase